MTIKQEPKLYQENTLTGEVLWIGKSGICTMTDFPIAETLTDEKYTYVVMRVKIDDN